MHVARGYASPSPGPAPLLASTFSTRSLLPASNVGRWLMQRLTVTGSDPHFGSGAPVSGGKKILGLKVPAGAAK